LNSHSNPRRRIAALLITLLAGALLAACGSSSSGSTTSTSTTSSTGSAAASTGAGSARGAALRQCLAQHGVTLPSRPPGSRPRTGGTPGAGGGLFGGGGGGRFANNPKLAAAFRACGGSFRGGRRFQLSHTAVTNFVTCVRAHGYQAMPNPNFSGKGPVFPASIRTNKQFLSASKSCANLLVRPGAGGAGGAPASGA